MHDRQVDQSLLPTWSLTLPGTWGSWGCLDYWLTQVHQLSVCLSAALRVFLCLSTFKRTYLYNYQLLYPSTSLYPSHVKSTYALTYLLPIYIICLPLYVFPLSVYRLTHLFAHLSTLILIHVFVYPSPVKCAFPVTNLLSTRRLPSHYLTSHIPIELYISIYIIRNTCISFSSNSTYVFAIQPLLTPYNI